MKILTVVDAGDDDVAGVLAGEALRAAATARSYAIDVEVRTTHGVMAPLDPGMTHADDRVLLVGTNGSDAARFGAHAQTQATLAEVLAGPASVIERVARAEPPSNGSAAAAPSAAVTRIVAITSCPTGIAHTFMAAEGLEKGASELGLPIRVETQGSVGAGNPLTAEEIAAADVVIIAADREVDRGRFGGKRLYAAGTKGAITDGKAFVTRALAEATLQAASAEGGAAPAGRQRTGAYKHLMNGVSFMLPFVVAGGLLIALSFAFGGIYAANTPGTLANAFFTIGAKAAFVLFIPALAGYIAFSIADRPGLAPGMIGGLLAVNAGAGFLGGIVAGFIAGYGVEFLNRVIKLPKNLAGLKPVLILPVLGSLLVGLLMIYAVETPVAHVLAFTTTWLKGMQGSSAIVLGALLGAMMAFDMGGPINKAAYAFSTGLLASDVFRPMAAVMVAGMTPPLGLALATKLFANRFTLEERESSNATAVLGLSFISEGAIPFAARDPFRVIPSIMVGSAVAGAISMAVGAELHVPHGGIFVLPIPGAVSHVWGYIVALVVGTVVSAGMLGLLKRPLETAPAPVVRAAVLAAALVSLGAALALNASQAAAQSAPAPAASPLATAAPVVTPAPAATATAPPRSVFTPVLNYTGEAAANPIGGILQRQAYAGQLLMGFDLDMSRIVGAQGGTLHFTVTNRHGDNLAANAIGNNTSVQEVYGTQNTHLAVLTYEQRLFHDRLDIEAGRIPANISFLNSPFYCGFQTNSACGNPTFVFKDSNFTYYPASSWGVHAKMFLTDRVYVHLGAYEVNPDRKRSTDDGFTFNTDHMTGVVAPGEIGYTTTFANDTHPRDYQIGGWYDGGTYSDPLLDAAGRIAILSGTAPATLQGRSGAFVRFDQMIVRPDLGSQRGLTLFGVGMTSVSGRVTEDHYLELGLVQTGTFAGRDRDTLGFVINDQHFTNLALDAVRAARVAAGGSSGIPTHETMMELAYGAQLGASVRVSPNVQYIVDPDQMGEPFRTGNIPNAFVVGLKFTLDAAPLFAAHAGR